MFNLKGKKILFLGASNYFYEAAQYAKSRGAEIIAIDRRPKEECVVKQIADKEFSIDTTDIESIVSLVKRENIDGIYPGASEVNIPVSIEVSERTGIPKYCEKSQWELATNKLIFKNTCIEYGLPVTPTYKVTDIMDKDQTKDIEYPIVTKPTDNNGSTGITICNDEKTLIKGYNFAKKSSKKGEVLIEKKMEFEHSLIAHYTAQNGKVIFCGLTDKESKKIKKNSAPVMSIQFMPSKLTNKFIDEVNEGIINMLEGLGIEYGPIWIEIFYDDNGFYLNEIGYRYGGSLTYYPVEYFYGINQMHLLINYLATGKPLYENFANSKLVTENKDSIYCILPIQIKEGRISAIKGLDKILKNDYVHAFIQSHIVGDIIEATGTTHQVFGYMHLVGDNKEDLLDFINYIGKNLIIEDEMGRNMLDIIYLR